MSINAIVAATQFTFKFMEDEEGGDVLVVLCPFDKLWHEAYGYFRTKYHAKHWTTEELRAIADKLKED